MTDPTPYTPPSLAGLGDGWAVQPAQVHSFSQAVQQVRDALSKVAGEVELLTQPAYRPQLGTSPVGQSLTEKFVDRLSGDGGLLPQLNTVLSHVDEFVASAEAIAKHYNETDSAAADSLHHT